MRLDYLPVGAPGVDSSQPGLGPQHAADLASAGKKFFLGCIGLPDVKEDCTDATLTAMTDAGHGAALYGFYRSKDWNATTGASDAALHLARLPSVTPPGAPLFCDLEWGGVGPSVVDLLAYMTAYYRAIETDGRVWPGFYFGRMSLVSAQIYAAVPGAIRWRSGMAGSPKLDYYLQQELAVPGKTMNVRIGQGVYDLDTNLGGMPWIIK